MIEVIAGTNRPGSATLKVANIIANIYKELGAEARVLDLQELPLSLYAPAAYGEKPAAFAPFQERILAADGMHVVVPEYNGSYPGVLKYFIDMLAFPASFEHRCVAYTGVAAGIWGGFRAVEQLQMVYGYRNAYSLPERVWFTAIHKKLSADGTAITDEFGAKLQRAQCEQFIDFVARNKGIAATGL